METQPKHIDCRNLAPLDVVKGICHRTKQVVLADDGGCEFFSPLPRCRICEKYSPGSDAALGACMAVAYQPFTYAELSAVTCQDFVCKTA